VSADSTSPDSPSLDFVRAKVAADVQSGRFGRPVKTRFPPEPNGFLHIGHAKAICLDFGVAQEYGGSCNLRMDDTNPETEDVTYVDNILGDVRWLGFEPAALCYASDYFEQFYDIAVQLIRQGDAYVCPLNDEDIRAYRGTAYEPGRDSPGRANSSEENLDLLARMRAGEFKDGAYTVRARIDMAASNMKMRDPLMYRIRHAHHYRTGDDWCIYPMYDYAHGLSDAIEGVTHSICTLEFENNRELYDWFLARAGFERPPEQTEFARLKLGYTMMSKRKLLQLVRDGLVSGWDDPRMPTIAGMRRLGIPAVALRNFAERVGVAKANSMVDAALFDSTVRDALNDIAPRVMCVLDPVPLIVENWPDGKIDWLTAPSWPQDAGLAGDRQVPFGGNLLIEADDYCDAPPKGWKRLAPGVEVRLRYGYVVRCTGADHDPVTGAVTAVRCTYDPATRGGDTPDGRKVKGTLHWVDASQALPCEVRVYERLFAVEEPGAERDALLDLNPDSLRVFVAARVEPSVQADPVDTRYQFERQGYFWRDPEDSRPDALVFNRTVALKDSWGKQVVGAPAPKVEPAVVAPPKAPAAAAAPTVADPAALDAMSRFGLDQSDAITLTSNPPLWAFFLGSAALAPGRAVANLLVNDVQAAHKLRPLAERPLTPATLATIVTLIEAGTVSSAVGRALLAELLEAPGDPLLMVEERGLQQNSDRDALAAQVDAVLSANPEAIARYREGRTNLLGFLVGQVIKAEGGKANPGMVRELVEARLAVS
jgi:glutaminyl-tRNA synthetase